MKEYRFRGMNLSSSFTVQGEVNERSRPVSSPTFFNSDGPTNKKFLVSLPYFEDEKVYLYPISTVKTIDE